MNEKTLCVILCLLLALSAGLAWFVSSSANNTLTIF